MDKKDEEMLKELQKINKNLSDISMALIALAGKDRWILTFESDGKLALYSKE